MFMILRTSFVSSRLCVCNEISQTQCNVWVTIEMNASAYMEVYADHNGWCAYAPVTAAAAAAGRKWTIKQNYHRIGNNGQSAHAEFTPSVY